MFDVFHYNFNAPEAMDPCQTKYFVKYSDIFRKDIHKIYCKDKFI
jgi:hypothetical protein